MFSPGCFEGAMIFAGGISGQDVSGGLPAFSLGDGRLNLVAEEARHGGPVEDHTERRQHPRSGSQHAQRLVVMAVLMPRSKS